MTTKTPSDTESDTDANPIPSYLYQISYAPDDDPFGEKRRPVTTTNLSEARQQLVEACINYVFNSLPTHLIRIADMTIVTRNEIWDVERPRIESIPDQELRDLRYEYSKGLGWHWTGFLEQSWCEAYAKDVFKFAIFSHRWGDREPLFQDMPSRSYPQVPVPSGPGYDKLRHLCVKAEADFCCRYVWSDTCCINKQSSSELEEALRSMYRWYNIANICIVHLGQSSTADDFDREPWFTRGWTLQELLASSMIRFYGKDWLPICPILHERGDKVSDDIVRALTRVTGIHKIHLQHFYPSCELVAQVMAWSAKRKTTRIEDRAYALLGLLNVSIPIAYGEGHRAFYRLMVALANECLTPAFFAWAGRHSDFSNALPASPACYATVDSQPEPYHDHDATPASTSASASESAAHPNTGHPAYEVTKLGLVVHLLLFSAHRQLAFRDGFHVGTTWHVIDPTDSDPDAPSDAPLAPIAVRAGTAATLPPLVSLPEEDDHTYALGIVNFTANDPGPGGDVQGTLARGCTYLGILMTNAKWGWEKLSTDQVLAVRCTRDTTRPVARVQLLHRTRVGTLDA